MAAVNGRPKPSRKLSIQRSRSPSCSVGTEWCPVGSQYIGTLPQCLSLQYEEDVSQGTVRLCKQKKKRSLRCGTVLPSPIRYRVSTRRRQAGYPRTPQGSSVQPGALAHRHSTVSYHSWVTAPDHHTWHTLARSGSGAKRPRVSNPAPISHGHTGSK